MYYRGPSAQTLGEDAAHRQLEDNATKALINVLEHSEPKVARSFAEQFAPPVAVGWLEGSVPTYYLQGGPHKIPGGPRLLLGLSIAGALDPKAVPARPDAGTRIDAAIAPRHGGLIAIETKVVELLDSHQLERHRVRWEIGADCVALVRWVDVWTWARGASKSARKPVSRFLLEQFCEYLEILGFGRWSGFRAEDFAQFSQWSWDHQPILRARMSTAWERVLELMRPADAGWLGRVGAGQLPRGSTHAWAQTNRDQHGTNLTLELGADELQFNLVGWTVSQAERLESWLIDHAGDAPDLDLVVHERRAQPDHKGAPYWMHATHTILRIFTATEVRAGRFSSWLDDWRGTADLTWARLAYHLRHTWSQGEVLGRGEDLAPEIAALATQTIPVLREINRWK